MFPIRNTSGKLSYTRNEIRKVVEVFNVNYIIQTFGSKCIEITDTPALTKDEIIRH